MRVAGLCIAGLLVLSTALDANAQEQISPEDFLARANGKTLTFSAYTSDAVIGVEQFLSTKLSVWAETSGRCSYGRIELRGPLMCFIYDAFPNPNNCWMPFDRDGELMVMSSDGFEIQVITNITRDPVICDDAPLS